MASVVLKRGKWWMRVKGNKSPGKWSTHPAPREATTRAEAQHFANVTQAAIDKRRGVATAGALLLRDWIETWLKRRAETDNEWKKDRGRLVNHVLPVLGDLPLAELTAARVAELVHQLRFVKKLANRTARNVYSVLAAVMRDATIAGKVSVSPCILTEAHLGPVIDKDPEWRGGALFTHDEAQTMISDPRIPLDRQLVYAFGLLAGMRPGEAAALRWRNYDNAKLPLGMLTAAKSYSTSRSVAKGTKTNAVKFVPVHPALAAILVEWRAGWERMFGRAPAPDDLIVPLPPDVKRTSRTGDRYRGWDYTGRRWREVDLPALKWRARSVYDTRATFITLALEAGADRAILRERVTHSKLKRDAFDGYDRGERWAETCREVSKLRLTRSVPRMYPEKSSSGKQLRRRVSNRHSAPPQLVVVQGGRGVTVCSCHPNEATVGTRHVPAKTVAGAAR